VLRYLAFAVLVFLAFLVLRSALASFMDGLRGAPRTGGRLARQELVKDPVCATYVPRRTAVARTAGAATYYFCGPACAEKFKIPS
jgi:YHS domain-containing protein